MGNAIQVDSEHKIIGNRLMRKKPNSEASYYLLADIPARIRRMGTDAIMAWYRDTRGRA